MAFAFNLQLQLFPTFHKQLNFEKSLSAIRLFVGKPSNSSIRNSERTVALVFSFLLANPYSQPQWVLITSAAAKQKSSSIFQISLDSGSSILICFIVNSYFDKELAELLIR